jgi:glycosyltransferase involved in cell wall biosynthesis
MFVFTDPFNRGLSHVPFNAGLIETALAADPGRRVVIAAEKEHLEGLAELVDRDIWRKAKRIPLMPPPPGSRFVPRLVADCRNLDPVFRSSSGRATFVLMDLAPATLYALRLNALRHPQAFRQFVAVLHGNAAELAGWRARNPFIRATQLRSAMAAVPRKTRFAVLEDSIRRALLDVAPEFAERFATLPHPLPTIEGNRQPGGWGEPAAEGAQELRPIRIAFLGAAQGKKGFDTFLELARNLTCRLPGRVEFHAIGWLPPESAGLDLSSLARQPSRNKIDRAEFLKALESIDYVCMPYSQELYRYSASGTLLDAVATGKPLVALRSPILEDLQTDFGDIGELGDSREQLEVQIEDLILRRDSHRYQRQRLVMKKICEARMPRNLVSHWRALCPDK